MPWPAESLLTAARAYTLAGMIHYRSPDGGGGHYIADLLFDGQWLRCDDHEVHRVREFGTGELDGATVYLYVARDTLQGFDLWNR